MLHPLPYRTAISCREEIPTDGNSPIKVIGDDYELYVTKNSKNKQPAADIINEVIAHYLLTLWDIPVAPAAIISVDASMLLPNYSNAHKKHYYNYPVFGSKWMDSAIDSNEFFAPGGKVNYRQFNNPDDLFKIGLFDIWVENDDRKPTNHNLLLVLENEKQTIMPIDHCYIFSTLRYSDLNPATFSPIANDNILISSLARGLLPVRRELAGKFEKDGDYFYLCVEKCKTNFAQVVQNIPAEWGFTDSDAQKVYDFLFDEQRSRAVLNDYYSKINP